MKTLITCCLLICGFIVGAQKPVVLKVMSYNIHHANPPGTDKIDLDTIAGVIKKQNPDIVALQEVDVVAGRSGKVDQANYLATKLGMKYVFVKAINFDGGQYGIALLSKFDISDTIKLALPQAQGMDGEPRAVGFAKIRVSKSKYFWFGFTHLDAEEKEDNRLVQMQFVLDQAKKLSGTVLLAGDFNANEKSPVIALLDKDFVRTCNNCDFTIPVDKPTETIDFIAFKQNAPIKILSHKVIKETYASDHLPVQAVLEIK